MVFILLRKYDQVTEVENPEENIDTEMARHMSVYYYMMNNRCVNEKNSFFERPSEAMRNHLKPLFIGGKIDNMAINKILVDGRATMNLMSRTILKNIRKSHMNTKPHNMVLSNYEGKVGTTLEFIQFDLTIDTITRPTMFMVVESKANYNLLLGHEWIHNIGVVPSSMHQRITIWHTDSILENIEVDQSCFLVEVNHVERCHFNKKLANTTPYNLANFAFSPDDNAYCSLYLHPTQGFLWNQYIIGNEDMGYGGIEDIQPNG